jgi:predicted nucleic acid-binding protein
MATRYVVDTNVLVYALDRREPEKRERAREVLRRISTDSITISGAPIFRSFSSAQRPLLWAMDFSSSTISAATLR